ncbi:MAG: metallophosphoesterase [Gammaproteobacteria bacterium]
MKLHILSDLHNEFLRDREPPPSHPWKGEIPDTDADVVILAGDIDTGLEGIAWSGRESRRLRKDVVYVAGNHEFYRHEYYSLKERIAAQVEGIPVHFLDCGVCVFDDVRVIGLTLWTDYAADAAMPRDLAMFHAGRSMVDHQLIRIRSQDNDRKFEPADALSLHRAERQWLEAQLKQPYAGKTVVVSHHAPHPMCENPAFPDSPINTAFYSDLEAIIAAYDIDLWVYGHTHSSLDVQMYGTRIVSNQAGYPGENVKDFSPDRLVEI